MDNIIRELEITNFKSIEKVNLNCKRINLFLGKPNAGKSNILEALGLMTVPYLVFYEINLFNIIRAEHLSNLFFDLNQTHEINVKTNTLNSSFGFNPSDKTYYLKINPKSSPEQEYLFNSEGESISSFKFFDSKIKLYRFKTIDKFNSFDEKYLIPPFGNNLEDTIANNENLYDEISLLIDSEGKSLSVGKESHRIEAGKPKSENSGKVNIPYKLFSDGFKRIMFNLALICSNKNSVILLEEPEAYYFPHYSQLIAEKIALSESNQFFVSTHNPYFLSTILSETGFKDLNIFVTYNRGGSTAVKCLTEDETQEIIDKDIDAFFNLERFIHD